MRMFSVYIHTFPNQKVYIGITSQKPESRWQNGTGYRYNIHLNNAIKKYGWKNIKHEVLLDNLTETEAKSKEIALIKQYNSTNSKYGYNVSLGGDCPSEATKKKISQSHYGIKPNKEAREKMRKAKLGTKRPKEVIEKCKRFGKDNHAFGRIVTEQERQHLRKLFKGKPAHANTVEANKVKIVQLSKDGTFIREFNSIKEASETLNIAYQKICHNCNGHQKAVGDFVFKHKGV